MYSVFDIHEGFLGESGILHALVTCELIVSEREELASLVMVTLAVRKDGPVLHLVYGDRLMLLHRTKRPAVFQIAAPLTKPETGRKTLVAYKPDILAVTMLADHCLPRS
jgi:hypothetical protein